MENWKPVKDFEGHYEVSDKGRVRSVDRITNTALKHNTHVIKKGKILKQNLKKKGYLTFDACKENIKKTKSVHRVVAEAFLPNPDDKPVVNHINGNKLDNRASNLEWVTSSENTQHAFSLNLMSGAQGKQILCVETGKVFDSSTQAAEWLNKEKFQHAKNIGGMARNIRACCVGKRKSAFGYRWKDLI